MTCTHDTIVRSHNKPGTWECTVCPQQFEPMKPEPPKEASCVVTDGKCPECGVCFEDFHVCKPKEAERCHIHSFVSPDECGCRQRWDAERPKEPEKCSCTDYYVCTKHDVLDKPNAGKCDLCKDPEYCGRGCLCPCHKPETYGKGDRELTKGLTELYGELQNAGEGKPCPNCHEPEKKCHCSYAKMYTKADVDERFRLHEENRRIDAEEEWEQEREFRKALLAFLAIWTIQEPDHHEEARMQDLKAIRSHFS